MPRPVIQSEAHTALIADFRTKLREVIDKKTWTAVAAELGVSRQALYDYYDENNPSLPGFDLIIAAMNLYGIVLESGGYVFGVREKVTPTF